MKHKNQLPLETRIKRQPLRVIVTSFVLIILIGTILLTLPVSSKTGNVTNPFTALFTATTSTCVTGLVLVDTFSHWSLFGQMVILALIQIGGLGLVTLTVFFLMLARRKTGLSGMILAQESVGGEICSLRELVRLVVLFSVATEAAGALLLSIRFIPLYGFAEGLWVSVFTAVSAYCNAGLDLFGRYGEFSSLTHFSGDFLVNVVIMLLIILGGIGFVVYQDLLLYRRRRQLMLHTRVVLISTAALILAGALLYLLFEFSNPETLGSVGFSEKLTASFFHSVTTRTAGFNTLSLAGMRTPTKLVFCLFMFIGAAPGSTGGGIKVTTAAVLLSLVVSTVRGREEASILHRTIPKRAIYRACSIFFLGLMLAAGATLILYYDSGVDLMSAAFEVFSAIGTVGLSLGITPSLHLTSKIVLIILMFLGRVGTMTFLLAIGRRQKKRKVEIIMPDGQIMVG